MTNSRTRLKYFPGSLLGLASLLACLSSLPQAALGADMAMHTQRAEQRIKSLHAQLAITEGQEDAWGAVAQVMRDDARTMDTLTQARRDHAQDMTAVDDLKSYSEVTDAHAQGLHKLTDAFAPLYASFSPAQRNDADRVFRSAVHHGGAHHGAAHKTAGAY